jgi:hypothetical membrane protein
MTLDLTEPVLFGMNVLTVVGLLATGFALTLRRMAKVGVPVSIGLMSAGTALVLIGLYISSR